MSKKNSVIATIISAAGGLAGNEKIQKTLFGVYSDGSPRSLPDALSGEILSPKDRQRMLYRKDKKKKRKYERTNEYYKKKTEKKKKKKVKPGKINFEI